MKKITCTIAGCLLASASFAANGYKPGRTPPSIVNAPNIVYAPNIGDAPNVGTDACPGLAIPDPGAANYTDTGTTIGATGTVNAVQAGCFNYTTAAGPDVVYQFALGPLGIRGATLAITVTPAATYDVSIYTLSTAGPGCPAGTGNNVTNCVNGADAAFAGGVETITDVETDAMPAGTYFLFIDSYYAAGAPSSGTYSLSMGVGPFPAELLEFRIE